jgi:hypothetical protein
MLAIALIACAGIYNQRTMCDARFGAAVYAFDSVG